MFISFARAALWGCIAALALSLHAVAAPLSYTLTDIGNFGTNSSGAGASYPSALNDSGQTVGYSLVYDANHAPLGTAGFLYDSGALWKLPSFGVSSDGTRSGHAAAINAQGQFAGDTALYDSTGRYRGQAAFLYDRSRFVNLRLLGRFGSDSTGVGNSYAVALNSSGRVLCSADTYDSFHRPQGKAAFLYASGGFANLGNFGTDANGLSDTVPVALNKSGQAAGYSYRYDASHIFRGMGGFLYANGRAADLGCFGTELNGKSFTRPYALNNRGQVVGSSNVYDAAHAAKGQEAFLYSGGALLRLPLLGTDAQGYRFSQAVGINDAGQVIGNGEVYDSSHEDRGLAAFLYQKGKSITLGDFGTDSQGRSFAYAAAINARGDVLGASSVYDSQHVYQGDDLFLYRDGVLTDISQSLSGDAGWTNLVPLALNNSGQILGYGVLNGSATEAFLLSPSGS